MSMNRRQFLGAGIATGAGSLLGACATHPTNSPESLTPNVAKPFLIGSSTDTLLAKGKATRIVIAGGGWGGSTAAKYLRKLAPEAEVILLERNPVFFSCPISNKWLVDMVDTSFLIHDYLATSQKYGYKFIQCEILDIDRSVRKVVTSLGSIDYDFLIIAPGIRYNYEAWFGNDRTMIDATKSKFPAAYIPNHEHFNLKKAIHSFKGGDWVMTLPPPPQRCPPSPYERACMIAWHFKTNKIKAKVTILDHKDDVRPINLGFKRAFKELYKDYIEYVPNAHIQEIDPFNKTIKTAAGDMKFDHAVLMAPHQAGDLIWKTGGIGVNPTTGKATGWAEVDNKMLHLKKDDRVYVIGDAVGLVSPQFLFYPKSGHIANRHGRIVAKYIAERLAGRNPEVSLPDNLCYMMVNGTPKEALNVQFDYKINEKGIIEQTQIDYNERKASFVADNFKWAGTMYEDMFG